MEGGTTAAVFAAHLEKVLLPSLQPGQVVVVDNVGAHKPNRMRALIEAAGCRLVFLPAYTPDSSPIDEASRKLALVIAGKGARHGHAAHLDLYPTRRLTFHLRTLLREGTHDTKAMSTMTWERAHAPQAFDDRFGGLGHSSSPSLTAVCRLLGGYHCRRAGVFDGSARAGGGRSRGLTPDLGHAESSSCWGSEMIRQPWPGRATPRSSVARPSTCTSPPLGATVRGIAEDLGIVRGTLRHWLEVYGTGKKTAADGTSTSSPVQSKPPAQVGSAGETAEQKIARLEAENAALRAETTKLTTEREILQRAAKYFAGETRW